MPGLVLDSGVTVEKMSVLLALGETVSKQTENLSLPFPVEVRKINLDEG